jgi:hypothetical protein
MAPKYWPRRQQLTTRISKLKLGVRLGAGYRGQGAGAFGPCAVSTSQLSVLSSSAAFANRAAALNPTLHTTSTLKSEPMAAPTGGRIVGRSLWFNSEALSPWLADGLGISCAVGRHGRAYPLSQAAPRPRPERSNPTVGILAHSLSLLLALKLKH